MRDLSGRRETGAIVVPVHGEQQLRPWQMTVVRFLLASSGRLPANRLV